MNASFPSSPLFYTTYEPTYPPFLPSFHKTTPAIDAPAKGHPTLTRARQELKRVDFSGAQAVLVASVPGVHKGAAEMGRYGACVIVCAGGGRRRWWWDVCVYI